MIDDNALRQQIASAERRITKLEFELAVERQVLERLKGMRGNSAQQPLSSGEPPRATRVVSGSLAHQAAAVLRAAGKPLRARDISNQLERQGVTSKGKTSLLALVISAMRRREDLFKRVRRGVYALKEEEP